MQEIAAALGQSLDSGKKAGDPRSYQQFPEEEGKSHGVSLEGATDCLFRADRNGASWRTRKIDDPGSFCNPY
jgi:hypothetical protein